MSETSMNQCSAQPAQSVQPGAVRRPYQRPAILRSTRIETRAGSPINPLREPVDPLNTPNNYGL